MILDLTTFIDQYFELKMLDGEVLKLKKPSQAMLVRIMAHEQTMKKANAKPQDVLVALVELLTDILNNNANGKEYDRKFVEDTFDIHMAMAVLRAYMDFVQEVNSNPNS